MNCLDRHRSKLLTAINPQKDWQRACTMLKRYHHTLDAFCQCPHQRLDAGEIRQIEMLVLESSSTSR